MTIEAELSKCVNCGICNGICPIYNLFKLENKSPRGYLNLMRRLVLEKAENSYEWLFDCFLCGKCVNICPLKINVPELIYSMRQLVSERWKAHSFLNETIVNFKSSGNIYRSRIKSPEGKLGKIVLFKGCVNQAFLQEDVKIVKSLLKRFNYDFGEFKHETCCGYPLERLGLKKMAQEAYEYNSDLIHSLNIEKVLTMCPTCKRTFKEKVSNETDFKTLSIMDFILEISGRLLPIVSGLDIEFVYVSSGEEDDEKALAIIQEIPKIKLSGIIDGFNCNEINHVNRPYAESIIKERVEDFMEKGVFIFISTSPINVYILREALRNKPVVVDSTIKLISLSLGIGA